jgi:alpha-ketoglutarate-dependent taurine dioxygenase
MTSNALTGCFIERPEDSHVTSRERILRQSAWYDEPKGVRLEAEAGRFPAYLPSTTALLAERGLAILEFDRALTTAELISLASTFGTPMPQPNPRTRPWVDNEVVLNLRADLSETEDLAWQLLFAENYVMLHTELAAKPAEAQPRWLLLECVEPPTRDAGGQTVLVAGERIQSALDERTRRILANTRLSSYPDAPSVLHRRHGREIFNFKDSGGHVPFEWLYEGPAEAITPSDVGAALRALLAALYEPDAVVGVHWTPHAVAIFDNRRFFHGRTFVYRQAGRPRHLRRVRVTESASDADRRDKCLRHREKE